MTDEFTKHKIALMQKINTIKYRVQEQYKVDQLLILLYQATVDKIRALFIDDVRLLKQQGGLENVIRQKVRHYLNFDIYSLPDQDRTELVQLFSRLISFI